MGNQKTSIEIRQAFKDLVDMVLENANAAPIYGSSDNAIETEDRHDHLAIKVDTAKIHFEDQNDAQNFVTKTNELLTAVDLCSIPVRDLNYQSITGEFKFGVPNRPCLKTDMANNTHTLTKLNKAKQNYAIELYSAKPQAMVLEG